MRWPHRLAALPELHTLCMLLLRTLVDAQENKCVNGGTPRQGTKHNCICPPDWTGMICNKRVCYNNKSIALDVSPQTESTTESVARLANSAGGTRQEKNICSCIDDNFLPPNCKTCKDVRLDERCEPDPNWHHGVPIHSPSDRHIDHSSQKKVGNVMHFAYALGFIIFLLLLASGLAIQQVVRIYHNEGWAGLLGNDEQTRLMTRQQEQQDDRRGAKPDVVVTQVRHIDRHNGPSSSYPRSSSIASGADIPPHTESYFHAMNHTAV